MKKLTLVLIVLLVALTSLVGVANATPVDELTSLAAYAPEGAPFFAAIRTDDAFIGSLNGILERIASAVDEALPEDADFGLVRDQIILDALDLPEDQAEGLSTWLGDNAAVFVTSAENILNAPELPIFVAFSVTDAEAAEAFLDSAFAEWIADGVIVKTGGLSDKVLYEQEFGTNMILTSDALILHDAGTPSDDLVLPGADLVSLSETSAFQDTVSALPEGDYDLVAYLDLYDIISEFGQLAAVLLRDQAPDLDLTSLTDALGRQAVGFTMLDARTLTIDVALNGANELSPAPFDQSILSNVPGDAALVVASDGLGDTVRGVLNLIDLLSPLLESSDTDLPFSLSNVVTFVRLSFQGTFGATLDDTLGWMNGPYAFYLNPVPLETETGTTLNPQPGFVLRSTDAGATAAFVDRLAELAQQSFTRVTYEDRVLTVPSNLVFNENLEVPDIDLQIAVQDDILAAGTSENVQFALNPEAGASIADSAVFQSESTYFLPDTSTLWYVDFTLLGDTLVDFIIANPTIIEEIGAENLRSLDALIGLLQSASITATQGGTVSSLRLSLTLSEE